MMDQALDTLKTMLVRHDWSYEYSDDYTQWCRGRDQSNAIRAEVNRLKALGLVAEVDALVTAHAPKR
jgi:hypothetical protein